jgi:hypothetical protein
MGYADVVDRIRSDFNDAPAMELTLGQAARLWHVGPDDCRYVLDALVDAGFLQWTARRTIARRHRGSRAPLQMMNVSAPAPGGERSRVEGRGSAG